MDSAKAFCLDDLKGSFRQLNRTTLVGRIAGVSANTATGEISLGLEAISEGSEPFRVAVTVPCQLEFIAKETLWYAKLWKKRRFIALEGAFEIREGCLSMFGPDIYPLSKKHAIEAT